MNRVFIKLLANRCDLGLGSLSLVAKELEEVKAALDNMNEILYAEPIRGEEEKSESDFFISPPLSVYDESQ